MAHTHSGTTDNAGNHYHLEINASSVGFNNAQYNLDASSYIAAQTSSSRGEAYALLKTSATANVGKSNTTGNHSHTIITNNTGGNAKHENRPPYIVINRWKRTA